MATEKSSDKNEQSAESADIIDVDVIEESPAPKQPAEAATEEKKGRPFMVRLGWGLAFLLLAFGAGVYFAPQFEAGLVTLGLRDEPATSVIVADTDKKLVADVKALSDRLTRHQEMLAQHETELTKAATAREELGKTIETLSMATPAAEGEVNVLAAESLIAFQERMDKLAADIARLSLTTAQKGPETTALTAALAQAKADQAVLQERMAALEASLSAVQNGHLLASPRGRLVLAVGRMKDRAMAGLPFGAEVQAVKSDVMSLSPLDQAALAGPFATLQNHAAGIAPYEKLVADFDDTANAAVRVKDKAEGNFLSSLFTVRRTDAAASGLDASLMKAEHLLLARDVAGAVQVLDGLKAEARDAVQPWRDKAAANMQVQAAFGQVMQLLASTEGDAQ